VKFTLQNLYFLLIVLTFCSGFGQEISLFQQFNGRYDFVFIGNTMNPAENNGRTFCEVGTTSSTTLNLGADDEIQSAFLYWAGSGTADQNVKLNNQDIVSQRTFEHFHLGSDFEWRNYFSAFADVTTLVKTTGNGNYTLSELDVNDGIEFFCENATNFAGWAIVIVYKNQNLPLYQLNVYDGLQGVPDALSIDLTNLNVIDSNNAQIGFIAWEGDRSLAIGETLSVNNQAISNPPLNPVTNAFNGTNSFTGSTRLYNMDLDVYGIQNNIRVGDRTANITLTSGQDVVLINVVVTKLNSLLPDATIAIKKAQACNSREITVDFSVMNYNSTKELPAGVQIAAYVNGQFTASAQTPAPIAIDSFENGTVTFTLPDGIPDEFELQLVVDDNGSGIGNIFEINEDNNRSTVERITLWFSPTFNPLQNLKICNEGLRSGTFNFSAYADSVKTNPGDTVVFYESSVDAESEIHPILDISNYQSTAPKEIFVRIDNAHCYVISSFLLTIRNCPPIIYNFISANNDGRNDHFTIRGLRDIFEQFKLSIYNRWGKLIWTGDNRSRDWDGEAVKGLVLDSGKVPDGTYFYVLELNDPDYPEPFIGYLYFHK